MSFIKLFLSFPAIALLLFTGFRLSIASGWLQIRKLPQAFSFLFKDSTGGFTSVAAVCAIVGGNLGVGNLSGTAVALRTGGPGFIVWMTLIIVVTSIIKYTTCYISMSTSEQVDGRVYGGPVVYLQQWTKKHWVALLVTAVTLVCALTVGNLVQVNSLSISMLLVEKPPLFAAIGMALALLYVTTLNAERLSNVISKVVPGMSIIYLTLVITALSRFSDGIVPSLKLICENVFSVGSFKDGAFMAFMAETFAIVQVGALRGVFATDIGLGLEGTVHAMVKGDKRIGNDFATQQSLISLISPFIVAIVTFLTTLVLLTTGAWTDLSLISTNMCFNAFMRAIGTDYTEYLLILVVFCFSFTTVLTWFICSKEVLSYVSNNNKWLEKLWTAFFILMIPLGALGTAELFWDIADISISISIIINSVGILMIFGKYKKEIFTATIEKKSLSRKSWGKR
ncbi:alanine:cation symporter family protein [Anaplasma platys]|nr:alanine:cation symporter family protein [Anaplasma platys]